MKESESVELKKSLVEAWGSGMPLILKKEPSVKFKEVAKLFIASFDRLSFMEDDGVTIDKTPQVTPQVQKLLVSLADEMSRIELMKSMGLKDRMHFAREFLLPATEAGFAEMTIPEKPNSRLQKYRLTKKGRDLIAKMAKDSGGGEK